MKVLYLTQVFETGQDTGSDRHSFFCTYLLSRGHQVTAITSNVDYKKATVRHAGSGWDVRRDIGGVDVHYVYSYSRFRGSFVKRVWYYLTYFLAAVLAALRVERPDVVYAVSTPLTVGLLGYVISRLRRVPFVFEVTDVWPDAALAVGVIREGTLASAARTLERFCYRHANTIVALTVGIRNTIIGKGVPAEKVVLITNGVDPRLFPDDAGLEDAAGRLRADLGITDDRLVAMYLGAHGAYNALPTILDAAACLRNDPRWVFVFIGDGDDKPRLEERVRKDGLENVRFLPPVRRADSSTYLRIADVFLLPNRRGDFYRMNLPNKLFDFLASRRPLVVAGAGESASLVQAAHAGLVVDAEDGPAMAAAMSALAALTAQERAAMGERGRAYVLEHYDRERLAGCFLGVLERAVGRPEAQDAVA